MKVRENHDRTDPATAAARRRRPARDLRGCGGCLRRRSADRRGHDLRAHRAQWRRQDLDGRRLTGYTRAAAGRITFNGRDIGALRPYRRARLGLARTFQSVELFDDLTVEENL